MISHGVSCVVWVINDDFGEQDVGLCSHLVYDMLGYACVFLDRMLGCARTWYNTLGCARVFVNRMLGCGQVLQPKRE